MPISSQKSSSGSGCLVLFAFPFAAIGTVTLYLALSTLFEAVAIQSWIKVPAHIQSAELKSGSGSDSGSTYSVKATYDYVVDGKSYTGNRVSLDTGSDSQVEHHRELFNQLKSHLDSGEPFLATVNPKDPSRSILFPQFRWFTFILLLVFAFAFGGVGYGMIFVAFWNRRRTQKEESLRQQFPGQPWRHKSEWADGVLRSKVGVFSVVLIVATVIWNSVSAPLWFVLPQEVLEKQNYIALIGLVFPLVGLGLLYGSVVTSLKWFKYGRSTFKLSTFPVVPGTAIQGVLQLAAPLDSQVRNIDVTIRCERVVARTRGSRTSSTSDAIFEEKRNFPVTGTSQIPISFPIPAEARESTSDENANDYRWKLVATCSQPGIDFKAEFEFPVYGKAKKSENLE